MEEPVVHVRRWEFGEYYVWNKENQGERQRLEEIHSRSVSWKPKEEEVLPRRKAPVILSNATKRLGKISVKIDSAM